MTRNPNNDLPILTELDGAERQLGSLEVRQGKRRTVLPLAAVEVFAKVIDRVSHVTVKQVFQNNLCEHLEAVYIFPLAPGSAVSSFNMKVGKRVIKGVVEERGAARQQYEQAIDDGKRAAIMEQERDDVFTVQVGNLPPGESVTIEISYSERLPFYENGSCELRLPLVVSPRYIPGTSLNRDSVGDGTAADTNLVPDASRITPPRLAPGVNPETAFKLKVEILQQFGTQINDLTCSQHASQANLSDGGITVTLTRADERLNRDFVLRWRSATESIKSSLLTYTAPDGETYGLLSIMPPRRAGYLGAPRDIVFVLDRSGSMNGMKMISAVRACSILLDTLGPQDRFAIAAFDNVVEWMTGYHGSHFVHANTAGIEHGERYLRGVSARGGTEMDNALKHAFSALDSRHQSSGRLPTLVVLTDGEVGNESQVLQRIQRQIGDARLFVVGIDTAVNSGLLKRLANLGGGTAAFVEPGNQLEEALASIGREIGAPLVTDIHVENLSLPVVRASFSPSRIPDIFTGRASVSFMKLTNSRGKILLKGQFADGRLFEERVKAQPVNMPCIAQLWAKAHIVDIEDQYRINPNARGNLKNEIINLAVKHSLLTKFTAFVVVDEAEIANQTGTWQKIVQPVAMPAGWAEQCNQPAAGVRMKHMSRIPTNIADQVCQSRAVYSAGASQDAYDSWGSGAQTGGWGAADPSDAWGAAPQIGKFQWSVAGNYGSSPPANSPASSNELQGSVIMNQQIKKQKVDAAREYEAYEADAGSGNSSDLSAAFKDHDFGSSGASFQQAPAPSLSPPAPGQLPPAPPPQAPVSRAQMQRPAQAPKMPQQPQAQPSPTPQPQQAPLPRQMNIGPISVSHAVHNTIEAIFDKLANSLRASNNKREAMQQQAEIATARAAIVVFFSEFDMAYSKLSHNSLPNANRLEKARLNLLHTLAPIKLGMDLPLMQRFLRAPAIELISSLHDTSLSLAELNAFWNTKSGLYNELKGEIESLLNPKEAAFWDASV